MKRTVKVMIAVWTAVALAIVGVMVYGVHSGKYIFSRYRNNYASSVSGTRELLLEEDIAMDGIQKVEVNLSSDGVNFLTADSDQFRVEHYGQNLDESFAIRVEQSGSTLKVDRVSSPNGFSDFTLFGFNPPMRRESTVNIYLPAEYHQEMRIQISSGMVEFKDDFQFSTLHLGCSSGMVRTYNSLEADKATIAASSGSIQLEELDAAQYSIDISSGMVTINQVTGSGNVNGTSGMISLKGVEITESLVARISSGSLRITLEGEPSLEFQGAVSSGVINTYFPTASSGKTKTATVGEGPYRKLNVTASSGNISIDSTTQTATYHAYEHDLDDLDEELDEYLERWEEEMDNWNERIEDWAEELEDRMDELDDRLQNRFG